MDVVGTCECGHDAKAHDGIDARFAGQTPCTGTVMGTTNFSGTIARTMRCTCNDYKNKAMVPA
jgi:hypothetical protein